ncbi:MAG: hypothetical protein Q9227_005655 [Pyrenula ochraceoflavens]
MRLDSLLPFLYPRPSLPLKCHRPTNFVKGLDLACPKCRRQARRSSRSLHTTAPAIHDNGNENFHSASRESSVTLVHKGNNPVPPSSTSPRLNPQPNDYSRSIFLDRCTITVHAGNGGNGCVSFLREKYVNEGQPNGGDGGSGGNVWIQACQGHTSLHKLARGGIIRAERGKGGQGKTQGGAKGKDVVIEVPVGTVVKEIWRSDPVAEEEERRRELGEEAWEDTGLVGGEDKGTARRRSKWVLYPGMTPQDSTAEERPPMPPPRKSNIAMMQPQAPIRLDLSENMEKPMLLVAGGMGGLGNPHFATRAMGKPLFATKGGLATRLKLELELKLLADVGLVGLPNAGKSTLLRSISNSRTRVGSWAFTTLSPSIGTVILDNDQGRPLTADITNSRNPTHPPLKSFTVADIPGLIEGAHQDKGLGLGFLRHIERAGILAFVVSLGAGDAVTALQNLWKEVGAYEHLRDFQVNLDTQQSTSGSEFSPFSFPPTAENNTRQSNMSSNDQEYRDDLGSNTEEEHAIYRSFSFSSSSSSSSSSLPVNPPISSKPWFVIATKADLSPSTTQANFSRLQTYLAAVEAGTEPHPGRRKNAWRQKLAAIPVSALRGEGGEGVIRWIVGLLEGNGGART